MQYKIAFSGHKNIRSLHKNSIEITKDSKLSPIGDCIIGVNAASGCEGIPRKIKTKLKDPRTNVICELIVNNYSFKIKGKGHEDLKCSDPTDIVLRKSKFVCPRTLAIMCDKGSEAIPRKMVELLQNPQTKGMLKIVVN